MAKYKSAVILDRGGGQDEFGPFNARTFHHHRITPDVVKSVVLLPTGDALVYGVVQFDGSHFRNGGPDNALFYPISLNGQNVDCYEATVDDTWIINLYDPKGQLFHQLNREDFRVTGNFWLDL
jgi:hypothetical protein